jgi:Rrf2 family protein
MRLTKSTSHAIRILLECASADDRLVKVAVLSERLDITQQNIFKIVNLLAKAGLLEAVRGRNGGVKLARPAGEVRIGDVVRASEVTRVEIEDDEDHRTHGRGHGVNQILDDALGAFIDVLDQHTLADMAKGQRIPGASPRRKVRGRTKPVAGTPHRVRRALHESN